MNDVIREYLVDSNVQDEQLIDLVFDAQKGCLESRAQVVKAKMYIVVSVLKKYKVEPHSPEYFDELNAGALDLSTGIDNFDPERGGLFSCLYVTVKNNFLNRRKTAVAYNARFTLDVSEEEAFYISNAHLGYQLSEELDPMEQLVFEEEMSAFKSKAYQSIEAALNDELIPEDERELMEVVVNTVLYSHENQLTKQLMKVTGKKKPGSAIKIKKHCISQFKSYLQAHGITAESGLKDLFSLT